MVMVAAAVVAVIAVPGVAHAQQVVDPVPEQVRVPLREAIAALPVATEVRDGYVRTKFRHWVDSDSNGCNTRAEVLLAEATIAPETTGRCTIVGGRWHSYYDNVDVDKAGGLDIDHMVPLAEAWDSGAIDWTPQRRQDYANDLGESRALVAVTAKTNRSKADQDPATWLPPDPDAVCTYLADWATVKTRWHLSVDEPEQRTLTARAQQCPNDPITTTLVP
ncbi:HNH endonuclease family protein [Actinokineospora terrae]|uniref:GmrSD restriction endonucleases C-terminal domain-containing protein n=1 Tax=Actinokineospora terrae TaxID=155974 RepID=A0A1H9MBF4_9PSEU|nr:HNH endonuclease family protein [Actinokineospora terrae]SER21026.1 Protein of unknown function [Actinokineospora terrae]